MIRNYSEIKRLLTFEERFEYLKLKGMVGESTFGYDRYMNQFFYKTKEWKRARDFVIIRDNGCDLGLPGYDIYDKIIVHHMNVISLEDIEEMKQDLFNPEFLICTSLNTHNAIHFGNKNLLFKMPINRKPGDTTPWK